MQTAAVSHSDPTSLKQPSVYVACKASVLANNHKEIAEKIMHHFYTGKATSKAGTFTTCQCYLGYTLGPRQGQAGGP